MTVEELIDILSDFDSDCEVRLMTQPSWPMQHAVAGVWYQAKHGGTDPDDEPVYDDNGVLVDERDERMEGIVYICEGGQPHNNPYGDARAWEEMETR